MKARGYNVYHAPDGNGEAYLGYARTLREARHLAATAPYELPDYLYSTAAAAGHCGGVSAPENDDEVEPVAWFGRGGEYCAVPVGR